MIAYDFCDSMFVIKKAILGAENLHIDILSYVLRDCRNRLLIFACIVTRTCRPSAAKHMSDFCMLIKKCICNVFVFKILLIFNAVFYFNCHFRQLKNSLLLAASADFHGRFVLVSTHAVVL